MKPTGNKHNVPITAPLLPASDARTPPPLLHHPLHLRVRRKPLAQHNVVLLHVEEPLQRRIRREPLLDDPPSPRRPDLHRHDRLVVFHAPADAPRGISDIQLGHHHVESELAHTLPVAVFIA